MRKRKATKKSQPQPQITIEEIAEPLSEITQHTEQIVLPPEIEEQNIVFRPNPGPQSVFLAAADREVLYGGAAGGGKAQPLYANIATPYGWKSMGDICVGDVVCTPDGGTATVVQLHPQGKQDIYTVTFQDGSTAECTEDHLWYCKPLRDGKERWKVRSTKELLSSRRKFVVPLGFVEREEKDLPIDPYVLGSLLGDGCITTRSISFTTADAETIEELSKYVTVTKRSGKYAYGILGVAKKLKELRLLGTNSYTKFVPQDYLLASAEQRTALLQGLLDTDGYVSVDGKINFTSMSFELRQNVAELVRSLGGTAKEFKGHTLYIRHPNSAKLFRLSRKKNRCRGKTINNKIVSIEKTGRFEAQCITIDSVDQLYVTDNYIVTHNSYAMLADPLRYMGHPQFSGLLLRHTTEELRELIWKSQEMYPKIYPGIKWSERKMQWVTPQGGRLWFSYLDRDEDVLRYQGLAFSWVGFDELTQWATPFAWNYMRSRLRSTAPDLPIFMRGTTNPGGPGHAWVKKMFIDPARPGTSFWATDIETGETLVYPKGHSKEGQPLFKRRFIPALLSDNPYLSAQGDYETMLLSLPEHQRKQLLEGNWDVSEGAAFPEFNRAIHVVDPFEIPKNWIKFRACDYGYGSFSAVLWFAVTPAEQLIVYRELYVSKVLAKDLARMVMEVEAGDGQIRYGVLDSSCWHKRGDTGPSLAEQMISEGCRWRPSDRSAGSRVAGKNEVHRRLQVDEFTEEPRLVFFSNCTNLISQLPILPLDKSNPEDIDTKVNFDHLYDALRYGMMSRPRFSVFDYDPASARRNTFVPADPTMGY
jgi:hypothetical protein